MKRAIVIRLRNLFIGLFLIGRASFIAWAIF